MSGVGAAFADKFVPEFDKMRSLGCTIDEEIFEDNGNIVSKNRYYRYYNLDDENSKIYLQKAPVEKILTYDESKIEFTTKHLTDDFMMSGKVVINKADNTIQSVSTIEYDSGLYPNRIAKAKGTCVELK